MIAVCVFLTVLTVAGAFVWWLEHQPNPDRVVTELVRSRVLVTLKSGEAFAGVLLDADDRSVKVAEATTNAGRAEVGVDGVLVILRADVAYMQFP